MRKTRDFQTSTVDAAVFRSVLLVWNLVLTKDERLMGNYEAYFSEKERTNFQM